MPVHNQQYTVPTTLSKNHQIKSGPFGTNRANKSHDKRFYKMRKIVLHAIFQNWSTKDDHKELKANQTDYVTRV